MGAEKRAPGRDDPARGNDSGWLKWFPIARWVVVGVFFAVILKDMNARLGRIEGKLDRRDVGYR
jgi:hypothetical protein